VFISKPVKYRDFISLCGATTPMLQGFEINTLIHWVKYRFFSPLKFSICYGYVILAEYNKRLDNEQVTNAVKASNTVTSVKQSPLLKGHLFLVLS
jgi:hypothetical protein